MKDQYPNVKDLTPSKVEEIQLVVMKSSAYLLLRPWQEECKLFLDYLKKKHASAGKKLEQEKSWNND